MLIIAWSDEWDAPFRYVNTGSFPIIFKKNGCVSYNYYSRIVTNDVMHLFLFRPFIV